MSKNSAFNDLCGTMLPLFFPLFLVLGCSSPHQSEQLPQAASIPEAIPVAKAQPQLPKPLKVAEKNSVAEVDEKKCIFFTQGSSSINHEERYKLGQLAKLLKINKEMHVTLIGHASGNGSSSFNLAVADARVESVRLALRRSGVKASQIKKKVIGSERSSGACQSPECRRKMRRVELVVLPTG